MSAADQGQDRGFRPGQITAGHRTAAAGAHPGHGHRVHQPLQFPVGFIKYQDLALMGRITVQAVAGIDAENLHAEKTRMEIGWHRRHDIAVGHRYGRAQILHAGPAFLVRKYLFHQSDALCRTELTVYLFRIDAYDFLHRRSLLFAVLIITKRKTVQRFFGEPA